MFVLSLRRCGRKIKNECSFSGRTGAMPKVSDEYRAARREQILDAAVRCAAREGFHKMTIAAVIAESGLSAGAVYGYFRGKAELIKALADRVVGGFAVALEEVAAGPGPVTVMSGMTAVLHHVDRLTEESGGVVPKIAVHVWSEAARDDEVATVLRQEIDTVYAAWRALLARAERDGTVPGGLDHDQLSRVLLGLMPGYLLQGKLLGVVDVEAYLAGVESLLGLAEQAPRPGR